MTEPTKYYDDGVTPTLAYWRSLFVFYGLTVSYADAMYGKAVHDGKWISHFTLAQNLENYRKKADPKDRIANQQPKSPNDPKPLVPWYMDLPPKREEQTISPEEQAEIDEIRNRIIAKFH